MEYTAIAVFVDEFSGFVHLYPLFDETAVSQAQALVQYIAANAPMETLVHDGGPSLVNKLMALLERQFGYHRHISSAYHPQGHGKVEQLISQLQSMLLSMCSANMLSPASWPDFLPLLQYLLNSTPSPQLDGVSPFEAFYARKPRTLLQQVFLESASQESRTFKTPNDWTTAVRIAQEAAAAELTSRLALVRNTKRDRSNAAHDRRHHARPFIASNGAYVMVLGNPRSKVQLAWTGPAKVVGRPDALHVQVEFLSEPGRIQTVHTSRVAFYCDDSLRESPELIEYATFLHAKFYDIDRILRMRHDKQAGRQFLVSWIGYATSDATWENAFELYRDAPVVVTQFLDSCSSGPQQTLAKEFREFLCAV
jgi:hypothetical protein